MDLRTIFHFVPVIQPKRCVPKWDFATLLSKATKDLDMLLDSGSGNHVDSQCICFDLTTNLKTRTILSLSLSPPCLCLSVCLSSFHFDTFHSVPQKPPPPIFHSFSPKKKSLFLIPFPVVYSVWFPRNSRKTINS